VNGPEFLLRRVPGFDQPFGPSGDDQGMELRFVSNAVGCAGECLATESVALELKVFYPRRHEPGLAIAIRDPDSFVSLECDVGRCVALAVGIGLEIGCFENLWMLEGSVR